MREAVAAGTTNETGNKVLRGGRLVASRPVDQYLGRISGFAGEPWAGVIRYARHHELFGSTGPGDSCCAKIQLPGVGEEGREPAMRQAGDA